MNFYSTTTYHTFLDHNGDGVGNDDDVKEIL